MVQAIWPHLLQDGHLLDGAQAISKMKVIDFIYTDGQISGIRARDLLTDQVIEVKAKLVINTSGPWVDKIRYLNFTRPIVPKMRPQLF